LRHIPLIVALLLVGCVTVKEDAPHSSLANELTLDVEAKPLTIGWGDSLHIRLTVSNTSNTTVVKHFGSGCIYGFSLWDSEGEHVAPPPRICTMNAPTVKYAPGESVQIDFQWVWDDMDIKPGTYFLLAGLGPRGENESAPPIEVRLE
jgi:hypothetical protein